MRFSTLFANKEVALNISHAIILEGGKVLDSSTTYEVNYPLSNE